MEHRVSIDCRKTPSVKNCSVVMSGNEDEIVELAVHHAVVAHGHEDTPELREAIRAQLEEDVEPGHPGPFEEQPSPNPT